MWCFDDLVFTNEGASELPEAAQVLGAEPDSPPAAEGSEQEVPVQEPEVHEIFPAGGCHNRLKRLVVRDLDVGSLLVV